MTAPAIMLPADHQIGANMPPEPIEPTPFQVAEKAVNDIYDEATAWLDGHAIDSQEHADGVARLLRTIQVAENLADDTRKAENKTFDDGKAEVQARYAVLIGDTKACKGKTVRAKAACKAALQPWLDAEDRRIKAEAAAAREAADRLRVEAETALRASDATDLAAREAAETLLHDARKADTAANVAGRQTATAGGSFGRAAGLRAVYRATICNEVDAVKSCWADPAGREALIAATLEWANAKVRTERVRSIPGFLIAEDRGVA